MEKHLKDILVPVDFKESSVNAIKYACTIAKKQGANILLLYVIEIPGFFSDMFSSADELVKITDKTKEKLHELTASFKKSNPDITIKTRIERGKPYVKILEVAKDINAKLIVLGENHQGDEKDKDLGTTVYHVTLKSSVPVITYKGTLDKIAERILVPLDLTKETSAKVKSAIIYGQNYGSKIYLTSALIGGIRMRESRIYKKLKKVKKTLNGNNIQCSIKLFGRSEKPPYKLVLDYAKEIDANMIMVMTHQEGYTYDNYIGAFAHHIINESRVPVLSLTSTASKENAVTTFVDPLGIFKNS